MAVPVFYGEEEEDSYWWILCLEKFFKEHETPKSLKVLKAVGALRGSAFTWWIWWCRVHPRYNWDTFTTALLWRFKPEWRPILPLDDEEEEPPYESIESMDPISEPVEEEPDPESLKLMDETSFHEDSIVEPVHQDVCEIVSNPFPNLKQQKIQSVSFAASSPYSKLTHLSCRPDSHFKHKVWMVMPNSGFHKNHLIQHHLGFRDDVDFSIPPKPPDPSFSKTPVKSHEATKITHPPPWFDSLVLKRFRRNRMNNISEEAQLQEAVTTLSSLTRHRWVWWSKRNPRATWEIFTTAFLRHFKLEWRHLRPTTDEITDGRMELSGVTLKSIKVSSFLDYSEKSTSVIVVENLEEQTNLIYFSQKSFHAFGCSLRFRVMVEPHNLILLYTIETYASQQSSPHILIGSQPHIIIHSEISFDFRMKTMLKIISDTVAHPFIHPLLACHTMTCILSVVGFYYCGTSESKKFANIEFSDVVHHMFVKLPLSATLLVYLNIILFQDLEIIFTLHNSSSLQLVCLSGISSNCVILESLPCKIIELRIAWPPLLGGYIHDELVHYDLQGKNNHKNEVVSSILFATTKYTNNIQQWLGNYQSSNSTGGIVPKLNQSEVETFLFQYYTITTHVTFLHVVIDVLTRNEVSMLYVVASTHNGLSYKVSVIIQNYTNGNGITFMEVASLHNFNHGLINHYGLIGSVSSEFLIGDIVFYGYAQDILIGLNSTFIVLFQSNTVKDEFIRMMCGIQRIEMFCYQEYFTVNWSTYWIHEFDRGVKGNDVAMLVGLQILKAWDIFTVWDWWDGEYDKYWLYGATRGKALAGIFQLSGQIMLVDPMAFIHKRHFILHFNSCVDVLATRDNINTFLWKEMLLVAQVIKIKLSQFKRWDPGRRKKNATLLLQP